MSDGTNSDDLPPIPAYDRSGKSGELPAIPPPPDASVTTSDGYESFSETLDGTEGPGKVQCFRDQEARWGRAKLTASAKSLGYKLYSETPGAVNGPQRAVPHPPSPAEAELRRPPTSQTAAAAVRDTAVDTDVQPALAPFAPIVLEDESVVGAAPAPPALPPPSAPAPSTAPVQSPAAIPTTNAPSPYPPGRPPLRIPSPAQGQGDYAHILPASVPQSPGASPPYPPALGAAVPRAVSPYPPGLSPKAPAHGAPLLPPAPAPAIAPPGHAPQASPYPPHIPKKSSPSTYTAASESRNAAPYPPFLPRTSPPVRQQLQPNQQTYQQQQGQYYPNQQQQQQQQHMPTPQAPPPSHHQQQQQAPLPHHIPKPAAPIPKVFTALYVPKETGWDRKGQGMLYVTFSERKKCAALVLESRTEEAMEFSIDAGTELNSNVAKFIIVQPPRQTMFAFSFNDDESCTQIWTSIQNAQRAQKELQNDLDAQRFWIMSQFAATVCVNTLCDSLQQHLRYVIAQRLLMIITDPYDQKQILQSVGLPGFISSCAQYSKLLQAPMLQDIVEQRWFHGIVGRIRAEELLHEQPIGAFLVRLSSQPLCFALDLVQQAVQASGGKFSLPTAAAGTMLYASLTELVKQEKAVLRYPVDRRGGILYTPQGDAIQQPRHTYVNLVQQSAGAQAAPEQPSPPPPSPSALAAQPAVRTPSPQSEFEIDWSELKLGRVIGSGGFGEVYEGKWRGTEVAVKVLSHSRMSERELNDFRAEVLMMSRLRHPNIVQFLCASLQPPRLALVTEYMKRGSLYAQLHTEGAARLSPETVVRIAGDIARGMNNLHLNRPPIIHRDLKSLNILVGNDWTVKVADFGLSRVKDFTHAMSKVGTPRWTAPEVLASKPYSEKADVYSFGIVLWEMVTGEVPFKNMSTIDAAHAVVTSQLRPPIPADCAPKLAALIKRCWDQDPHKRPSFEDILVMLDTVLS